MTKFKGVFNCVYIGIMLWIVCCLQKANGLSCFNCFDTYHPRLCRHVGQCGTGQVCGLQKHIYHNAETRYDLGCFSQQMCNLNGTHGSCTQCCNTDLCNVKGCGEHGFSAHRGHICYNCDGVLSASECKTVAVCDPGEMCFIEEQQSDGESYYVTSCRSKYICDLINGGQPVIGRKKRNKQRRTITCSQCCNRDLCNTQCGDGSQQNMGSLSSTFSPHLTATSISTTQQTTQKPKESNGRTFYFAFLKNFDHNLDKRALIYIISEVSGNCVIKIPFSNVNKTISVNIGITEFEIQNNIKLFSNGIEKKAVKVDCNVDIALNVINAEQHSTDVMLALPLSALSTHYIVPSYNVPYQVQDYASELAVVSTEDNTFVNITLGKQCTEYIYQGFTYTAGDVINVQLNEFGTLQMISQYDLSGTIIQSSKNVGVISGNRALKGGSHGCEMILPVKYFDHQFIVPQIYNSRFPQCRIFSTIPTTGNIITADGITHFQILKDNLFIERKCDKTELISTSTAIMVVLYARQEYFPFMTLIPGTSQYLSSYNIAVYNSTKYPFTSYLTVMTPITDNFRSDIVIDGQNYTAMNIHKVVTEKHNYTTFTVPISQGYNKVYSKSQTPFGLIISGSSLDGYGYPAGLRLN